MYFLFKPFEFIKTTVGIFLGCWSHIVLDAIMHADVEPYFPFSIFNPFFGTVPLIQLHYFCVFGFLLGLIIIFVRFFLK